MIKIWDIPTRLFHWSLVVLFVFLIVSGESDDLMEYHFYAGYLLSGLILFRVIWGVVGTRYARFTSFNLNLAEAIQYTKALINSDQQSHYGHTPAGSVMVILMLLLISMQLVTGMMSTDDIIWNGPLYNFVDEDTAGLAGEIHEATQLLLQILVGLHVLAIILYKYRFKEELVPAMLHGKKPKQGEGAEREAMNWASFLVAAFPSSGLTYYLFTLPI